MERELCEAGQKEELEAQSLGGPLASLFCLVHVMNPSPQQHRLSASKDAHGRLYVGVAFGDTAIQQENAVYGQAHPTSRLLVRGDDGRCLPVRCLQRT